MFPAVKNPISQLKQQFEFSCDETLERTARRKTWEKREYLSQTHVIAIIKTFHSFPGKTKSGEEKMLQWILSEKQFQTQSVPFAVENFIWKSRFAAKYYSTREILFVYFDGTAALNMNILCFPKLPLR